MPIKNMFLTTLPITSSMLMVISNRQLNIQDLMHLVFIQNLEQDAVHIAEEYYNKVVPMIPLTEQEKEKFKTEKKCHICERSLDVLPPLLVKKLVTAKRAIEYYASLGDEEVIQHHTRILKETTEKLWANKRKVADHDHLTGQFRGATHSYCNLTY